MLRLPLTWRVCAAVGKIGVSRHRITSSDSTSLSAVSTEFLGTALEEPFHLSYPYVFRHQNRAYMIPETSGLREVCPAALLCPALLSSSKWCESAVRCVCTNRWTFRTAG
jgi:hypothetical protein